MYKHLQEREIKLQTINILITQRVVEIMMADKYEASLRYGQRVLFFKKSRKKWGPSHQQS